jgi:hypothetical protein
MDDNQKGHPGRLLVSGLITVSKLNNQPTLVHASVVQVPGLVSYLEMVLVRDTQEISQN